MWLNGQWGIVSDNFWSFQDTTVVCRQLGRSGLIIFSYYGYDNNLPVVMSYVNCEGNESRLLDCSYSTGGSGYTVFLTCSYQSE